MATKIELPVSLGLQEAIQQANYLRKMLNDSVKPDTKSFSNILNVLNKIDTTAGSLRGKLNSAFTNSKASSAFLKDYSRLLEMLETVKSSFTDIGLSEIKISIEDSKKVEEYTKKIAELQAQIQAVQGGKIGGFFNLDEFKQAKALLDQIKIDPSNFTFKGLTDELNSEIKKTQSSIEELDKQFQNAKNVVDNLGKGNLDNLNNSLQKATENAAGLVRKITSSDTRTSVSAKLAQMYSSLDGIKLNAPQIDQNTNIDATIKEQTEKIVKAYESRITELKVIKNQVQAAQDDLGKVTNESQFNSILTSDTFKGIVEKFDISSDIDQILNNVQLTVGEKSTAVKELLKTVLNLNDTEIIKFEGLKSSVPKEIEALFDGLTDTVVSKAEPFKKALKQVFSDKDINIGQIKEVQDIINNIQVDDKPVEIIQKITDALKNYVSNAESTTVNSKQYEDLTASLQQLQAALQGVNNVQIKGNSDIADKEKEVNSLYSAIENLLRVAHGEKIKIPVDNGDLEKGKKAIESYISSLSSLEGKQKALGNVQNAVTRWMGFYQVLNLAKRAVNDMKQHITELDTVMTKIAVVTNMTTADLWNQIGTYSEIARQYGVAIKGVYEVSQIYYQQGLNKGDVMGLTTETLKMARVAGIDYATAADYMTTAIRGFKLEMSEAAHVTDVFSNLAAHTASSTEELATAISKTAASAANVGASFEATSAMMATMIATTRESATNIGTALKSIISRYGEMKANPTGTDQEGEEYSLNKVDAALKSIGISIQDANHQFRDFDDVILELGEKWDSIDKSAQRYIATVMAGNRQQSRFLALISNVEEYKKALELAQNSENAGELQTLKTLNSIDAKMERMRVTIQEFYTSSGIEDFYKGLLDTITNVISAANDLPTIFNGFPATALLVGLQLVNTIKSVLTLIIASIQQGLEQVKTHFKNVGQVLTEEGANAGTNSGRSFVERFRAEMQKLQSDGSMGKITAFFNTSLGQIASRYASAALSIISSYKTIDAMNKYGASTSIQEDRAARADMWVSTAASAGSGAINGALTGAAGGPVAMAAGAILGAITSAIPSVIQLISMSTESLKRKIELDEKASQAANQEKLVKSGEERELQTAYDKLSALREASYESAEAMAEYKEYMNQLADNYPALVSGMDLLGNKTIEIADLENALATARSAAAAATVAALEAEKSVTQDYQISASTLNKVAQDTKAEIIRQDHKIGISFEQNHGLEDDDDAKADFIAELLEDRDTNLYSEEFIASIEKRVKELSHNENLEEAILQITKEQKLQLYNEFLRGILDAYGYEIEHPLNTQIQDNFYNALKNFDDENKNIDIKALLKAQFGYENLEEIKNLSITEIEKVVNYIQNYTSQLSSSLKNSIKNLESNIEYSKINEAVIDYQGANGLSTKQGKYSGFMSYMITNMSEAQRTPEQTDIEYEQAQKDLLQTRIKNLSEWVSKYAADADWLMNELDYSTISTVSDLKTILSNHKIEEAGDEADQSFIQEYKKQYSEVRDAYRESLLHLFNTSDGAISTKQFAQLRNLTTGKIRLNTQLLQQIQASFSTYQSFLDNGMTIAADNYINGIIDVFTAVSKMENQEDVTSILSTLDFSDIDQVSEAITALEDIEGTEDVVANLKQVLSTLNRSIGVTISSMVSNAADTVEAAEKVLDNIGKGMDKSDAIKAAQEIINNSSKLQKDGKTATDLIDFDEDLGQWTLTSEAIVEAWNQTKESYKKQLSDISRQAELIQDQVILNALRDIDQDITGDDLIAQLNQTLNGQTVNGVKISGAEVNKLAQTIQNIQKSYKDAGGEEALGQSFEEYLKEQISSFNEAEYQMIQTLLNNTPITQLAKVNYEALADGTATESDKEYLRTILQIVGVASDRIDTIMNDVAQAKYESLETTLAVLGINFKINDTSKKKNASANAQQYLTLYNELTDDSIQQLSKEAQDAAKELGWSDIIVSASNLKEYPNIVASMLSQTQTAIDEFYNEGLISLENYNNVLSKAAQQVNKEDIKAKAVLDMAKDGISIEELTSFVTKFGGQFNDYWDKATNQFKDENLNQIFKYDEKTQSMVPKANATAAQIFAALAKAFGVTLDGFTESASETIDQQIAQRAKDNQGNQIKTQLSKLASAGVGEEVNISLLTADMKNAIGLNKNAETIKIASETERDALILLLNNVIQSYNGEGKELLQSWYNSTKTSIESKKPNEYAAFKGVLSTTVTEDVAKTYLKSQGLQNLENASKTDIQHAMQSRGYDWDEYTQQYRANGLALVEAQNRLNEAIDANASPETIAELSADVANLADALDPKQKQDNAVLAVLQNYENASNEVIETLKSQFTLAKGYDWSSIITDEGETNKVNIDLLIEALKAIGYEFTDAANEVIASISNSFFNDVSDAVSLASQGTNDVTKMEAFKTSFKDITGDEVQFAYNEVLEAWAIDPSVLRIYYKAYAEKLAAEGKIKPEDAKAWAEAQIKSTFVDSIDIKSFVTSEQTAKSRNQFKKQIEDYIKLYGNVHPREVESVAEQYINIIEAGDTAAVEILKEIKPEATAEEIEAVFKAKVNRISNAMDQLATLEKGDFLDQSTIDILKGIVTTDNGMVTSITNLVDAYSQLYENMKNTNIATTSELNKAYAQVLNASEQSEMDAISVLSDAMGMTYDALGDMLSKYGILLEDAITDMYNYGFEQIGNGKIRIYDFEAFASIGLQGGSEEYTAAFKAYNDSLIALDRKTEKSIYDEVSKIASAKGGERVNLTETARILDKNLTDEAKNTLNDKLTKAGASLNNGILTLAENADIAGAIDAIASQEVIAASLIPEELAELQDTVDGLLTSMIGLIKNGISGSLNNKDAGTLQSFAGKRGLKLDFTKTANGLKLSTKSAMQLYLTMKDVDKLQAQQLLPEISKMSDNYGSLQNACERYNELIKSNTENLREEKAVLEDLIKSMLTTPDSYNFMSNKNLPASWQYAENYLTNMTSALDKLKAASKNQFIGTSDFYNIISAANAYNPDFNVNGMNYNELLSQAGNAITLKNGQVGIDLSKKGLNLNLKDLQSIYNQLKDGLGLMGRQAEAYYDVNDKFERIGDAVNRLPKIDFSTIFPKGEVDLTAFQDYIASFSTAMPDLTKSLEDISVNGRKLSDLFGENATWGDWEKAGFTTETFTKFIQGIGEIDWSDATQAAAHVSELVKEAGVGVELDIDPNTIVRINPTGKALKIDLNNKTFRKKVLDEYNKYLKSKDKKTAGIQDKDLISALNTLADTDVTNLELEERLNIRRILAIAEGKFDPSNFVVKDGKLSYTYNGQQFSVQIAGKTATDDEKAKLGREIAQAIELEDEGFDFEVDSKGTISGHQLLRGGLLMNVEVQEDGNKRYTATYNGITATGNSYKECLQDAIKKGIADETQKGQTVELDNGKQGTVAIDSKTGFTYTTYLDEVGKRHYIYEGIDFNSYKEWRDYMNLREEFGGEVEHNDKTNTNVIHIVDGIDVIVAKTVEGITTEYYIGGLKIEGNNPKAAISAWAAAEEQSQFKQGEQSLWSVDHGKGRLATFVQNDVDVILKVYTDGHIEYSFDAPGYGTFTANSKEGFENALAGLSVLSGGELGGNNDDTSYTITKGNIVLVVNNGTVQVQNPDGTPYEGKLDPNTQAAIDKLTQAGDITATVDETDAKTKLEELLKKAEELTEPKNIKITTTASLAMTTLTKLKTILDSMRDATIKVSVEPASAKGTVTSRTTKIPTSKIINPNIPTIANAGGTPTLMGELGPELVVSDGRYFVVGQTGAEIVDLAKDAIVFNHIQTRQLLSNGKTGRGKPYTNEYTAAGMAKGNINGGPAHVKTTGNTLLDWKGGKITAAALNVLVNLSKEQKSKLSSLISDLITKGFDGIDWADIEKTLKKDLTDELKKSAKNGSLREFVQKYGDYCGKTIKEINDLYFQAWEADLGTIGESFQNALSGIQFFAGGSAAGSKDDWSTLLSAYNLKIGDLVDAGILEWNQALGKYMLTSTEELWKNFNVDITGVHGANTLTADMNAAVNLMNKASKNNKTAFTKDEQKKFEDTLTSAGISVKDLWTEDGALDPKKLEEIQAAIKKSKKLTKEQQTQWLNRLQGITKTNPTAQIIDSIGNSIDQIDEWIQQGLAGTISEEDKGKLKDVLEKMGVKTDDLWSEDGGFLDFTKVEEIREQIKHNTKLTKEQREKWLNQLDTLVREEGNTVQDLIDEGNNEKDGITAEERKRLMSQLGIDKKDFVKNEDGTYRWRSDEEYKAALQKARDKKLITKTDHSQKLAQVEDSVRETAEQTAELFEKAIDGTITAQEELILKDSDIGKYIKFDEKGNLDQKKIQEFFESDEFKALPEAIQDYYKTYLKDIMNDYNNSIGDLIQKAQTGVTEEEKKNLIKTLGLTEDDFETVNGQLRLTAEGYKKALKKGKKRDYVTDQDYDTALAEVEQSKRDVAQAIVSSMDDAVNGVLGDKDKDTFLQNLKDTGFDVSKLKWKETAEGWQLDVKSVQDLITQAGGIENLSKPLQDYLKSHFGDSITQYQSEISSLLSKSETISGEGLSETEKTKLMKELDLKEEDFIKGDDGLWKLTADAYDKAAKRAKKRNKITEQSKNDLLSHVEDSQREAYKTIINSFQDALDGTLSSSGIDTLLSQMDQTALKGILTKDDFKSMGLDGYALTPEKIAEVKAKIQEKIESGEIDKTLGNSMLSMIDQMVTSANEETRTLLQSASSEGLSDEDKKKLQDKLSLAGVGKIGEKYWKKVGDNWVVDAKAYKNKIAALEAQGVITATERDEMLAGIEDSLREAIKSISDLLSTALSGELTKADFNKLNTYLDQNGFSKIGESMLTETVDGYILSFEAINQIENEIANNKELNSTQKTALRNKLEDLKTETLNNTTSYITSLMEGTLSSTDLSKLQSNLSAIGIDNISENLLTKTASGWRISIQEASNLIAKVAAKADASAAVAEQSSAITATIEDSIRSTISSVSDLLSNILTGSITSADLNTLNDELKSAGLDQLLRSGLTETMDGWTSNIVTLRTLAVRAASSNLSDVQKTKITATVSDAIRTSISSITEAVGKGITGELTAIDLANLNSMLKANGLGQIAEDAITETANGFSIKLSEITRLQKDILSNVSLSTTQKRSMIASLEDSVNSALDSITELIGKSLTGELSNVDVETLKNTLKANGITNFSDKFFEKTTNGWALSLERVGDWLAKIAKDESLSDEQKARLTKAVKEAMDNAVSSINDLISQGLSGELSYTNMTQLKSLLSANGFYDLSDDVLKETVNGWMINLKGAQVLIAQIASNKGLSSNQKAQLTAAINDAVREAANTIASLISQGMTGSLSSTDLNKLQSYLRANNIAEISESAITQTVDGLKISNAEAIRLYTALKGVNDMASRIVLKQLIEDLKSSNEHYKTMSGTLARIKELQEQIAKYEKSNPAKANQYKEELAIAKEIATVRATTDDDSMNFLNADLPSGFNNPLNYIQNWITGIKNLRDALGKDGSGIMDFQSLYNMANEVNRQAAAAGKSIQFLGYTFDGSAQAMSKFGVAMADALGSNNGEFGVVLSNLGLNMKDGANGYAEDADEAMKTMAKAQIAILDELITYFEGLVALEALGDIDTDLNGVLDLSEIFEDAGEKNQKGGQVFTSKTQKAVSSIIDTINNNKDLTALTKSIKVGGHSIYSILNDIAKDGIANLNLTSEQYQDVLNTLYKLVTEGDFDLQNLPESLREVFNKYFGDENQVIDLGDRSINVKYGFTIEKDKKTGKWKGTDGKEYDTKDAAMQASVLNSLGSDMDKAEDGKNGDKQVTKYVGLNNYEMKYVVNSKGETSYWYDGKPYKTLDEVYTAIWKKTRENGNKQSENEWRASQGLPEKAVKKNNTTWELDLNKENQVLKIGKAEYTVSTKTDANGTVYTYDGQKYTSLEELQRAIWKKDKKKNKKTGKDETFEEWQVRVGLTTEVDTKITANGVGVQDLTSAGISAILNKSWTQIKEEWDNAVKEGKTAKFEATYGFKFDANTTEEDWENWRKKIGTMDILIKTFAVSDDAKKSIQELFGIGENGINLNLTGAAKEDIEAIQNLLKQINSKTIKVNIEGNAINTLTTIIKKLGKIKDTGTQVTVNQTGGGEAKGNVALAVGRTLMGELGPELVVAGGRYYTVGNNGAEFVNLPKDAIVFNHLQTQRLLAGGSVGRGTPAVNEAAAVSFVKGTALASASETLAQLKTLRAMWQSLLSSSIKDLIGTVAANSGSSSSNRTGAWLQEVERWYDLLQKIARLEKEINKAESERNFIQSQRVVSGTRLYELDVQELANYKEQAAAQKQLYVEQAKRWEIRRQELNEGPISTFYEYDKQGQLKFKDEGFAKLEAIVHQTDEGKTMSASAQRDQMLSYNGKLADYMKYDSSGLAIEREDDETEDAFALRQLQALWDRMESERNELQSLHDASEDAYNSYYEAMTNANNILNAMYDNQRDLEDKVLTAIEKQRQDTIDTLTEERQALSDSASKYISSLTDALNNEKAMYENSENEADLAKLRRQLSILQRNGGSASQIADLQSQIAEKDRDAYYDAQQDSIDVVQEASDLELEKLQEQIDLMTETLDYEKAHGLLWDEVRDIMSQDSGTITDFITGHDDTWLSKSTLAQQEELRTLNSSVEQWIGFRDTSDETLLGMIDDGIEAIVNALYDKDPVTYIPGEQGTPDSKNPYIDESKYTEGAPSTNGSNGGNNGSNGNNNTNMDAAQQISSGNFKYKVTAEDYAIYKKQVNKAKTGEEAKWVDAKSGNLTSEKLTATATGDDWNKVEEEAAKALKTAFEEKYKPKDDKHQYVLLRWKESTAEDGQIPHMKRGLSYRAGGEVNYTGTAEVHGSNERPEYMLNADEYQVWKHQIVGGGNSSLMSRLSELNAIIGHMEDTRSYEHGSGEAFVIENASVNMYVDEIANDYDAQRAGEQALEKIMQIARKSSSNNRIGR